MDRVVFLPSGAKPADGLRPLGKAATGSWGLADDAWLLATPGAELLYLGRAEYDHEMRRLDRHDLPPAVALRRKLFSSQLPNLAEGELATRKMYALALAARAGESAHVDRILATLVPLWGPSRFAVGTEAARVGILVEIEQRLRTELADDLGAPLAVVGEVTTHTQFYRELVALLGALGDHDLDGPGELFSPLVRGYLVKPASKALTEGWNYDGYPTVHHGGGAVGPFSQIDAAEARQRGLRLKVLFPNGNMIAGMKFASTRPQLEVELEDRERDPGMAEYLCRLRVDLAISRRIFAANLTTPVGPATLRRQVPLENELVAAALTASPVWLDGKPPASAADAGARLRELERDTIAAAKLLARLVAVRDPEEALAIEALSKLFSDDLDRL